MASQSRLGAFCLHSGAAAVMAYGWFGLQGLTVSEWINTQKGGHLQFLTIQGLAVAWLSMTLSTIYDLTGLGLVKSLKRILLMIALPLSIVISSVYWSLLLAFPELILRPEGSTGSEPSSSEAAPEPYRIPLQIDLALHAAPAISLFADFLLFEKKYSDKQAKIGGFVVAALSGIGYSWWAEYCAKHNGIFPYPFLTVSPFEVRVAIYTVLTLFAYQFFVWLNALRR
ncbi:hypothetical protein QCA50_003212 [Cerrena zonata]|uniref:FAR-17a/AIG1-like protein n=1 Tax=Cerrena zonata TaxID=2478898 RepID=A0AAW0GJ08_9APHY